MSARLRRRRLVFAIAALAVGARTTRAGDPSPAELVRQLADADTNKRYEAYTALLAKHPPEALPLLAKAVPSLPIASQSYGVTVVAGYPPADVKPVFERWLSADAPYVVASAGAGLLRMGDAKGAPAVVKVLESADADPSMRSMMLSALYGVRDPRVLAAVRGLLKPDAPVEVLGAALNQLRGAQDAASAAAVTGFLAAPAAGVRALAATYLLTLGDEARADVLATALDTGEVGFAELNRVETMLAQTPRVPDVLLDALTTMAGRETNLASLLVAIRLLGRYGYVKAAPVLQKLLDREEPAVSGAAFDALSKLPGAMTPDVVKALLETKDEARRVSAAEALRRGDDLSGLPAVIDVLRHGKTARMQAATALGSFRSRAAIDPLVEALVDPDLAVRAAAYNALTRVLTLLFPYRRLDLSKVGYTTTATPDALAAGQARIKAWWDAHKDGSW